MPDTAPRLLVLDTHVWLWSVSSGSESLSKKSLSIIEDVSRSGGILIPAICIWEVAMLESRARIRLSRPLREWIEAALKAPGTRLLELSPAIAIESTRLPGAFHGDPADRLIVASARVTGATVATRDKRILEYARSSHLEVLDVS